MGNYIVSNNNRAIIISGVGGTRVAVGECACQKWGCEASQRISLELMTLPIASSQAETTKGVRVDVSAVAQIKVKSLKDGMQAPHYDKETIQLAAQHFLGDNEQAIKGAITQTLEGHQRQILGTLTVEEIYKDKNAFAQRIKEHVVSDLLNMGFELVSYTVTAIDDQDGYMASLGRTQTALVKREAEEGEAMQNAAKIKKVAKYNAEATMEKARHESEAHVVTMEQQQRQKAANRDFDIRKAEFDREVRIANEKSEAAGRIERAEQEQVVKKNVALQRKIEMQVNVEIAEQEALVLQRQKEGMAVAELQAEKSRAESVRVNATAEAEKIQMIGEAQAASVLAKGEADAAILQKKADAYKQYGEAALVQMVVEQLPALASSIAAPLANTDKMVFVSQDGAAGSMLTGDINRIVAQLPETVEGLTGIDLRKLIKRSTDKAL